MTGPVEAPAQPNLNTFVRLIDIGVPPATLDQAKTTRLHSLYFLLFSVPRG